MDMANLLPAAYVNAAARHRQSRNIRIIISDKSGFYYIVIFYFRIADGLTRPIIIISPEQSDSPQLLVATCRHRRTRRLLRSSVWTLTSTQRSRTDHV